MRERVEAGHPNRTELFDIKHDRGGMVDIEFIVQYWVLLHARERSGVDAQCGQYFAAADRGGVSGLFRADEAETDRGGLSVVSEVAA